MCDQTEVSYLENDVVWVKIGPIWWPGVVKNLEKDEEGREILAGLKKKPIAVVQFFQEDNYEFVKNLEHIYHYSCRRKDEFIKKGLDKFRTGASHMKKFPDDVTTAESLINGDVNIINDPKFFPEKKESYSEIFGSGKKKGKKDSNVLLKPKNKTSASVKPYRPITHQRFINKVLHGESDHKVKTLIQCNTSPDNAVSRNFYKCHICKFETTRVNVIVTHHRLSHSPKNSINWTGSDSKLSRRKPVYKSRKNKSKKLFDTSKEDLTDEGNCNDDDDDDDDDDDNDDLDKKSPKKKILKEKIKGIEKSKNEEILVSPFKRKNKEETSEVSDSKKPRFTDVLLADWNDDDEDKKEELKNDKIHDGLEKNENKHENTFPLIDLPDNSDSQSPSKNQNEKMSCFDFDDEEEGFIGMSNANTYGRKIPRVIPVKDKSELGMDLEIEELFKKKSDVESEVSQDSSTNLGSEENKNKSELESTESVDDDKEKYKEDGSLSVEPGKRRRSKASKDEDFKINSEDSLALRRPRRPGAKKSYLNEVIEKIDNEESEESLPIENKDVAVEEGETKIEVNKVLKEETSSSSRRKQDFKQNSIDRNNEREEIVYTDIVSCEQKVTIPSESVENRRTKIQSKDSRRRASEDLTTQIENLLEETKICSLRTVSENSDEKSEKSEESKSGNAKNFSFDYLPLEQPGKKLGKTKTEVKSISRLFSDSIPLSDCAHDAFGDSQKVVSENLATRELVEEKITTDDSQIKNPVGVPLKLSQSSGNNTQKKGSAILGSLTKTSDTAIGQVKVSPVVKQSSKDCITLPAGKKLDIKKSNIDDLEQNPTGGETSRSRNIKTIKVKTDSLPSSLLTSGKLKGQTIIHQKGGKYVIVTQPPQAGRQRPVPGKVQSGSKVVIFTNQLGEQKIITASGLQQSKFKVENQKGVGNSDPSSENESAVTSGSVGQSQPVIKMVPDGKGGIMKHLTVSPKKVLLGGTKVLVSGSGSTLSSGNSVQKIALTGSGGIARTAGGDFRLIENYKGSGKTVLIQGSSSPASGVVLKPTSVVSRQITKVIQSPQTNSNLKKKPKILMRASTGHGEYVMQSTSEASESPTFVVKQKGSDGKFSSQKIVRSEILNQPRVAPTVSGPKTFFVSGQGPSKKGESYIITTNEPVSGKVIRMRQKLKEMEMSSLKPAQKIIQKAPEVYSISENSLLISSQGPSENETSSVVQVQESPQQPVLQTQVIAMPGPVGSDGNQTFVLVSVDENGVVQGMDNSVVAYDTTAQPDQIYINPSSTSNVILINPQNNEEITPVYSTSSQDILAEALANTKVLEGSINSEMDPMVPSILLPPSIPSSVVQETSVTLQKPIMTPLEMPSSVAPNTSGLEPPPLPPTPTEDVLMEESDIVEGKGRQEQQIQINKKEIESTPMESIQKLIEPENFEVNESEFEIADFSKENEHQKGFDERFEVKKLDGIRETYKKTPEFYETDGPNEDTQQSPQGQLNEHCQEEQSVNSFQSLPILNDEPDTSDDVQSLGPVADAFAVEKNSEEPQQLCGLLREQEPPSSTNNDMVTENNHKKRFEKVTLQNDSACDVDNIEKETKSKDGEEHNEEQNKNESQQNEKEQNTVTEGQPIPIIADENNVNTYEIDPIYSDVISQKRFQEETEVSSTTDEFANKGVSN